MASRRPKYRITFQQKASKGSGQRGEWYNDHEAAVWPPHERAPDRVAGNVRFGEGAELKVNGKVIKLDDCWVALETISAPDAGSDDDVSF